MVIRLGDLREAVLAGHLSQCPARDNLDKMPRQGASITKSNLKSVSYLQPFPAPIHSGLNDIHAGTKKMENIIEDLVDATSSTLSYLHVLV